MVGHMEKEHTITLSKDTTLRNVWLRQLAHLCIWSNTSPKQSGLKDFVSGIFSYVSDAYLKMVTQL